MSKSENNKTALVIGGSISGLLASKALSRHFDRVVLLERDKFPEKPMSRGGVPQGGHLHALMSGGAFVIEEMVPGFFRDLEKNGSMIVDATRDMALHFFNAWQPRDLCGIPYFMQSRAFLDWSIIQRLKKEKNIELRDDCFVSELLTSQDRTRVTGVKLKNRTTEKEEEMSADLVVDAGGRSSRTPIWLEALGYAKPPKEEVKIDICYTSRNFQMDDAPRDWNAMFIYPMPPRTTRMGGLMHQDNGEFIATLAGYFNDQAPEDLDGYLEYAKTLNSPEMYDALKNAEPRGEARVFRLPSARRLRFDKLKRFPAGLICLGAAVCSFNPIWGQGMTSGALQAQALGKCLEQKGLDDDFYRSYFKAQKKICDVPWTLAGAEDFRYAKTEGKRPFGIKILHWYTAQVYELMAQDHEAYTEFIKTIHFLQGPEAFFKPKIFFKVVKWLFSSRKRNLEPKLPPLTPEASQRPLDFSAYKF